MATRNDGHSHKYMDHLHHRFFFFRREWKNNPEELCVASIPVVHSWDL